MIIKRFTGKTEDEAKEAARKELGSGAVIMNVRSVKKKGLAGLFGGKQIEVTAAREEDNVALKPVRRDAVEAVSEAAVSRQVRAGAVSQPVSGMVNESSQNIEKKLDSLQTLLVSRLQQEEAAKVEQPAAEGTESADGKEAGDAEIDEQEKFFRLLYNTMLENEVDEKYANQIMNDAEKSRKPNLPFDHILANVYQKMILKFGKADGIPAAEKEPEKPKAKTARKKTAKAENKE